ncbi:phosphotransferase family enzyme [Cytobacillus firmus]|uniref:Phosphotransferase family enzyme n=2 Tax=Cytobacillus TaxID=2675230 RepID=A0A366JQS3_CYTFI|nr:MULTISPECIES: aminoglycoside phosphotransferase family protein [Cytobacillus]RBP89901.1 phosphotransferase family enzyme [Cytobacillus firmus]TDX40349.1 phosphotransferase family enzyme [Cytobacillus oceanisediminis]
MNLGTPIAKGNTAKIYLYKNRIYKVFNDYLSETESHIECEKQKYAYSCGLSVPKIIDLTKIDGKQAIIMEYIKGRSIGDILSENMEQAEYYMNISVDIQQKIHKVEAHSIENMTEKLSRQIVSANILDNKQKSTLIQRLDRMTFKSRLCHGDYHLFNLIMLDNNVAIIDWVDSSAGDICADVYRTYLLYSQFSHEFAEMYLQLYCEKSGLVKDEVLQWAPIVAAARLSEIVPSENSERLLKIVNQYCPL